MSALTNKLGCILQLYLTETTIHLGHTRYLTDSARKRKRKEVSLTYNKTRFSTRHQYERCLSNRTFVKFVDQEFKHLSIFGQKIFGMMSSVFVCVSNKMQVIIKRFQPFYVAIFSIFIFLICYGIFMLQYRSIAKYNKNSLKIVKG